jgi:hypothetical protein
MGKITSQISAPSSIVPHRQCVDPLLPEQDEDEDSVDDDNANINTDN